MNIVPIHVRACTHSIQEYSLTYGISNPQHAPTLSSKQMMRYFVVLVLINAYHHNCVDDLRYYICDECSLMADELRCEYCSVCRYNHSEGRKHIYVKSHQQKLSVILNKFGEKVQLARRCVLKPSVLEGELEPDSQVWCHCCDKDVP